MIRVAFIFNHSQIVGGGEISFIELINSVRIYGVEPIAVVPGNGDVKQMLDNNGIISHTIDFPSLRRTGILKFPSVVKKLKLFFIENNIHIVHTNGARCMLFAGSASRLVDIPCIWHVRVMERDRLLDRVRSLLSSLVIANSNAVARSLMPLLPSKVPLHIIYNGINLENTKKAKAEDIRTQFNLPGAPVVLGVGRVTEEKGYEDLIRASKRLTEKRMKHSVLIIGDTPNTEYLSYLNTLLKEYNLKNWLWLGWRDDVFSLMKSADVMVMSSHREGFGRVIVESWACGLPVIATNQGGPSEIINSGKDGILVRPGQDKELSIALEKVIEDRLLAETLAEEGMQRVREFSLSNHAENVFKRYRGIINQSMKSS
jgi:glycosyltransferase involved in cell wall biosynthesis